MSKYALAMVITCRNVLNSDRFRFINQTQNVYNSWGMLEEHLGQFLQHMRYERNVSPHTLRNYSSDLEQFNEHLFRVNKSSRIPVEEIDRLTIREWMASLHADDKKKTSIARKLASLRTFFQFLVREGI